MIKNIIFDLGGVILKNNPSTIMKNLEINQSDYNIIYKKFFNNLSILDDGYMSLKEYFIQCKLPIELKNKYENVLSTYYKYREYNNEIINTINNLKKNQYKIYILSNNNRETYDYLLNQNTLNNIDGWILSCEYHICKPKPEIYDILLNKYNLKNEECFFIDDSELNINVGKSKGINGTVFKNIEILINDMKHNGIKI